MSGGKFKVRAFLSAFPRPLFQFLFASTVSVQTLSLQEAALFPCELWEKKRLSFQLWLSDLKAPPGFWQEGLASGVMLAAPAVPSAQRPLHRLPGPRVEPPRGADLGWDWPPFCLPGGVCIVLKPLQCVLCHKRQGGGGNAGAQRMCSPLKESGCWKLLHPCRVQG